MIHARSQLIDIWLIPFFPLTTHEISSAYFYFLVDGFFHIPHVGLKMRGIIFKRILRHRLCTNRAEVTGTDGRCCTRTPGPSKIIGKCHDDSREFRGYLKRRYLIEYLIDLDGRARLTDAGRPLRFGRHYCCPNVGQHHVGRIEFNLISQ